MMLKFLKRFTVFLVFTAVFYVLILVLWQRYFPNALKRNMLHLDQDYLYSVNTFQDIKSKKNVDILFLGSSHAYRGFDTRIFAQQGWESFNLGSSSQTPLQTELLVENYLEQLNPKLIVYDLYPSSFTFDGVESSLDVLVNEKINANTLKMVLQTNHIKTYNAYIYLFLKQLFKPNPIPVARTKTRIDEYIGNGYVESKLRFNLDTSNFISDSLIFLDKQKAAFERIVQKINKKNIPLLLVQAPVTKKYSESMVNLAKMDHYFISNCPLYFNFNTILSLSDQLHFFDYHHLNQQGVRIFNDSLIKIIHREKLLQHDLH